MHPIERLHQIVDGIDRDQLDKPRDGWWETSAGVEFGAGVLRELEELIRSLM